jgi:RNase P subunit RPR2
MTFDHKEASEKLVELYPSAREAIRYNNTLNPEYITRDIGELMKLAIKNELMITIEVIS